MGRIIPIITERSLIRKPSDVSGKQERWEKILKEAAEQCGRGRIPTLSPVEKAYLETVKGLEKKAKKKSRETKQ